MYSLEQIKKIFENRGYVLLTTDYNNNKQYLTFEKDGYLFYNSLNGFIKTDNFKKWGKNNPYSIKNLQYYIKQNNIPVSIPEQSYNRDMLKIICACGREYSISWSNFLCGKQYCCPCCGRQQSAIKHYKNKYKLLMEEKKLVPMFEYHGCKHYNYYITEDGFVVKTSLYNVYTGRNFYDTIFDVCNEYTLNNIYHYFELYYPKMKFLSDKYIGATARYKFQCECGQQFETDWYNFIHGNKICCDYCTHSISSFARKTEEWLNKNHINFIKEQTFIDCVYKNLLRFDYYLPELNKLIEVDGPQHERPVCFGGCSVDEALQQFQQTKIKDNIKDEYCIKNNIPLLRIKYTQFNTEEYKLLLQTFTS